MQIEVHDDAATIGAALATIVRRANQPRMHDRIAERAGVRLERALYGVLGRVGDLGPVGLSPLAAELGVDLSTLSRQVKQLERLGHIARRADPSDRRASIVALTPSGRRILSRFHAARRDAVAELLAGFSPGERATLARLLDRLASAIALR